MKENKFKTLILRGEFVRIYSPAFGGAFVGLTDTPYLVPNTANIDGIVLDCGIDADKRPDDLADLKECKLVDVTVIIHDTTDEQ